MEDCVSDRPVQVSVSVLWVIVGLCVRTHPEVHAPSCQIMETAATQTHLDSPKRHLYASTTIGTHRHVKPLNIQVCQCK